jgi:fungalysin metallopeptidase (M36)
MGDTAITIMPRGNVYLWTPDSRSTLGGHLAVSSVPLPRLEACGDGCSRLWGRHVRVRNGGEINEPLPSGNGSRIVPIGDARPNIDGDFIFEPGRGGGRIDKVNWDGASASPAELLESGVPFPEPQFRWRYIQAAHFGEVNAYFHLDMIADYVDGLLRELDAQSLPRVTAVVNAHHAVTERDGIRDGLQRGDRWLPFQGGHYRLPAARYDLQEHEPISPEGEIHLGPGRNLLQYGALVEAVCGPYRANASHNAGILYHEYGHHLTRHTADFRANALRPSTRQDNRKVAIDEGTCDYFAATVLDTPHIWAWHLRHDDEVIHPRSLNSSKTMADYDTSATADAHANGTIWAAALWDLRIQLSRTEEDGVRRADLMVVQALLLLGQLVETSGEKPVNGIRRLRMSFGKGAAAIIQADEVLHSGRHRDVILASFSARGIEPHDLRDLQLLTAHETAITEQVARAD